MEREEVEAKLQEIHQALKNARNDFYQLKKRKDGGSGKAKVLSQDEAKAIIESMKKPLASLRVAPGKAMCTYVSLSLHSMK